MALSPEKTELNLPNTLVDRIAASSRGASKLEPYLVVISGNDQGKQFKLDNARHVLGREPNLDIVISDPKISRRHVLLSRDRHFIHLEDLNSTNGTFVNGQRVSKHKLTLLDRIRVGDTFLKIDYKHSCEADSERALYEAANIDSLTNTLNRHAFMLRAQQELDFCRRYGHGLTVMMCDADHFKRTNDNFGHLAGDEVLRALAKILTAEMRQEDSLSRYGGEEFIILLREISSETAAALAERIRQTVMDHSFRYQNLHMPTTISIGVCCCKIVAETSLESIIQAADNALYRAKTQGRNRVEMEIR